MFLANAKKIADQRKKEATKPPAPIHIDAQKENPVNQTKLERFLANANKIAQQNKKPPEPEPKEPEKPKEAPVN